MTFNINKLISSKENWNPGMNDKNINSEEQKVWLLLVSYLSILQSTRTNFTEPGLFSLRS